MSDDHLRTSQQHSTDARTADARAQGDRDGGPTSATPPEDGAENRGRRAGVTQSGEVTGSGASAGGGGNPEDIDSDPQSGGGGVRLKTDAPRPTTGADAPSHNSA